MRCRNDRVVHVRGCKGFAYEYNINFEFKLFITVFKIKRSSLFDCELNDMGFIVALTVQPYYFTIIRNSIVKDNRNLNSNFILIQLNW